MSSTTLRSSYQPLPTKMDNPILSRNSSGSGSSGSDVERSGLDENVIGLPATQSTNHLMGQTESLQPPRGRILNATTSQWFAVAVLCFVNLINYMDRFTIAGVLNEIQKDFKIGDDNGGLLQTVFVLSYMVCAPVFGYLGDRYSRPWIMAIGVFVWSTTTLLGSFMQSFGWFVAFRALVGIGEASYSTIAPTLISDMFVNDMRSKMLAVFYFAIPVGSGLGYIVGSETANFANNWRWALRVTPALGIIAVVLIMLIKEPERGESEGSHHLQATTYMEDIKDLSRNRSFMLSTVGFTCVAFVTGALAWWGPKFIFLGLSMQQGNENLVETDVSYKFGIIAMLAGLIGVPFGAVLAQRLRPMWENCDPLICGVGLLISAPMVYASLVLAKTSTNMCLLFVFIAQVTLNLCWSIVADILLYVVVPTRRSTAEAFQILISHAFGDAGSPYLVGVISELIKKHLRTATQETTALVSSGFENLALTLEGFNATSLTTIEATTEPNFLEFGDQDTKLSQFKALQYALFSTCFIEFLGGVFFLITAAYIVNDKRKAAQAVRELGN